MNGIRNELRKARTDRDVNLQLREHLLAAGAFISTVIPLIVFFSLQRYFVRGILAGSVKG